MQQPTIKTIIAQIKTNERELLQVREAAEELGVTMQTIRRHVADGEFRAVRLGANGRYRIHRCDLEQFLTEPKP